MTLLIVSFFIVLIFYMASDITKNSNVYQDEIYISIFKIIIIKISSKEKRFEQIANSPKRSKH